MHYMPTVAPSAAYLHQLEWSHFDCFTPAAIRARLGRLTGTVDMLALDIRKMYVLNQVVGYHANNTTIRDLVNVRHAPGRPADLVGQWGGDEFLFVTPAGDGPGMLGRLLRTLVGINAQLGSSVRAELHRRSGGVIDGYHIAAVLSEGVAGDYLATANRLHDTVTTLKASGPDTGSRATSGAIGTVLMRMGGDGCTR